MSDISYKVKRALSRGFIVTSGLLMMRLAAFLTSIIIARLSGAETLGQYTLFLTVFILASEIPAAFDTAYLRSIDENSDSNTLSIYQLANLASKLIVLLVVSCIFWALTDVIADFLGKPSSGRIILMAVICGGLNSMYMLMAAIAQQRHDFSKVAILKPVFNALVVITVCYLALTSQEISIERIFNVYLTVGLVLALFTAIYLSTRLSIDDMTKGNIVIYIKTSFILIVSMAIAQIGNRLDVFFLSSYLNYEQLGIYGVALRLSIVVSIFTATIQTIMMPRATAATRDIDKFRRYLSLSGFYGFIQVVCGVVLLFLIEDIILLLFGDGYSDSVLPASILIIQALVVSLGIPFQALLQCGDKPSLMIAISIFRVLVAVPVLIYLVPIYGVVGASISVLITTVLLTFVVIAVAMKLRPVANTRLS